MILYIIRGLPGTGKSTYAKTLGCFHVESDMFHQQDGKYAYDKRNQKLAIAWCQKTVYYAMSEKMDVVVSNIFITNDQIAPFLHMAKTFGYTVKIFAMIKEYGSIHGVPDESLASMRENWEHVPGEILIDF